jgi:hypothetical protein
MFSFYNKPMRCRLPAGGSPRPKLGSGTLEVDALSVANVKLGGASSHVECVPISRA